MQPLPSGSAETTKEHGSEHGADETLRTADHRRQFFITHTIQSGPGSADGGGGSPIILRDTKDRWLVAGCWPAPANL
ncbi:unnamed protein product [Cylicostephanus goldi]|uniref:Uncharacterized protein n=1 Tax=Cylicostephanus goldi TaxID=71465 RepID=A0A3P7MUD3_CYLGO|nr:unnamed protein product [Cylicostephanus goldi]